MKSKKGEFDQFSDWRYDDELDSWAMQYSELDPNLNRHKQLLDNIKIEYRKNDSFNDDYYPF